MTIVPRTWWNQYLLLGMERRIYWLTGLGLRLYDLV